MTGSGATGCWGEHNHLHDWMRLLQPQTGGGVGRHPVITHQAGESLSVTGRIICNNILSLAQSLLQILDILRRSLFLSLTTIVHSFSVHSVEIMYSSTMSMYREQDNLITYRSCTQHYSACCLCRGASRQGEREK